KNNLVRNSYSVRAPQIVFVAIWASPLPRIQQSFHAVTEKSVVILNRATHSFRSLNENFWSVGVLNVAVICNDVPERRSKWDDLKTFLHDNPALSRSDKT